MSVLYVLENKINGKCYVGQTCNIEQRSNYHKKYKIQPKQIIDKAINKYSWDGFNQYIYYIPKFELDYFEIEVIKQLGSLVPNGYNVDLGGHKNKHRSKETRKKMSEAAKNKPPVSEETKKKMSVAKKGQIPWNKGLTKETDERLKKMGNLLKGKVSGFKNKCHSKKAKKKNSEAHKGRTSPNKGKIMSEGQKEKLSVALKGKPWSKKRRDAQIKRKEILCQ